MSSTPTSRNRLNKQGTGDNPSTWGNILNTSVFDLIDESLDGLTSIVVNGDITLSSTNYIADQSRKRILKFTGAGGFTVTLPGVEKVYILHNTCTAIVSVKTASGGAVNIQPNQVTFIYCDGTNCYQATATGSSVFTIKIVAPAATTGKASLNVPHGTAPTAPVDGDIWTTTTNGLQYQVNGRTLRPGVEIISSGTATAVAVIDVELAGGFSAYRLLVNHFSSSVSGASEGLRVSTDGGVSYQSGVGAYSYVYKVIKSDGTESLVGTTNSFIFLGTDISTDGGGMLEIIIDNPGPGVNYKPIRFNSSYRDSIGNTVDWRGSGYYGSIATITHLRFYTGLSTFSCKWSLAGLR
jgi:hypothetical protein